MTDGHSDINYSYMQYINLVNIKENPHNKSTLQLLYRSGTWL